MYTSVLLFQAGYLSQHYSVWGEITSDQEVHQAVVQGMKLEFLESPL